MEQSKFSFSHHMNKLILNNFGFFVQFFKELARRSWWMCLIKTELRKHVPIYFFQRLQEIDDNLLKVVRGSSGRNPAGVEAEIRELEKELKIPGIALSSSKVLKKVASKP